MEKVRFECESYYEAVLCECGGAYLNESAPIQLLTDPPKKEYSCNKCGSKMLLTCHDFPQMKIKLGKKLTDA